MIGRDAREHAEETSELRRRFSGLVRKFLVKVTADAAGAARGIWQVARALTNEAIDAEVYQGIGFASRPRSTSRAEAVVVAVGGASAPAVVGLRDEDLRKLAAGDLAEDETAIFTSRARIRIKADGTIEIAALGGAALSLPTLADVVAIKTAIHDAAVAPNDGGATFKANILTALASWPTGTTVLKGQ